MVGISSPFEGITFPSSHLVCEFSRSEDFTRYHSSPSLSSPNTDDHDTNDSPIVSYRDCMHEKDSKMHNLMDSLSISPTYQKM